ncbi:glycoside hydrolase family 2 protein [Acidipila rosea]|uniref:Beta-glucuronidase n=1 Tax=Acidipila rosea TaxID=768535 RepID=A0A4R1L219_9BACT|nr:glycoside hydrolase family 2 TIM barrel-domain containing protein [Acidipila rosea]TCK72015.1 beta-glucuronidase [Acidipila rosea]
MLLMLSHGRFAAFCLTLLLCAVAYGQQTKLLVDVDHRTQTSLNGPWHYIVDPYRGGWGNNPEKADLNGYAKNAHTNSVGGPTEYNFEKSPTLNVPGDWNTQKKELLFYEGLMWYEKDFTYHPKAGMRTFLNFGAVNYRADVFVNGQPVCTHEGGFTQFDCEVTSTLKDGDNFVVVAVDDTRTVERVPTLKTDWWNYGGITREVSLVEVPEKYIDDYSLQLKKGSENEIDGYVHVTGASAGTEVSVSVPALHVTKTAQTDGDGRAAFSFKAAGLQRWSPEHPQLYDVAMQAGSDELKDQIGFRTVEVQGDKILLNGEPLFLRGVCMHAETPYKTGRAWSQQDAETLLGWVHEMHGNFVRLAHYPYDENFTRTADRMGILVWSEVPVYWSIDWASPAAFASASQQLHENIRRDHNKASVILWSMSNETPVSDARTEFIHKLTVLAREQDPTRLITSAVVTHFTGKTAVMNDPLGQYLDVLGYNEYIGWYMGKVDEIPDYTWEDPMGKPLIMSEFGGGAKAGMHGDVNTRFSEEFQAKLLDEQFAMFKKIPFLAGLTPWVLMDFRSPTRQLPGLQDFFNRKGFISDQGEKKKAFFTVQRYYGELQQKPELNVEEFYAKQGMKN